MQQRGLAPLLHSLSANSVPDGWRRLELTGTETDEEIADTIVRHVHFLRANP